MEREPASRWIWVCAVPFAALSVWVAVYGVDIPFYDQWKFSIVVERLLEGTWTWSDLYSQHNEHRLLFPRLVMAGLVRLTDWNTHYERFTSVALSVLLFLGVARALSRAMAPRRPGVLPLLLVATFVCSLHQWENWLWGWQLQVFMSVAALIWSLVVLDETRGSPGALLAVGLGVVASFSFASGLSVWPLGVFVLLAGQRSAKRRALTVWCLGAALTLAAYFATYEFTSPFRSVEVSASAGNVLRSFGALFGCAWIGPADLATANLVGAGALLVLAVFLVLAWRARLEVPALVPLLGITLYAVLVGGAISFGRLRYEPEHAFASRYVTLAGVLWLSVVALSYVQVHRIGSSRRMQRIWRVAAIGVLAVLLTFQLRGHARGRRQSEFLERCVDVMITGKDVTRELAERLDPYLAGFGVGKEIVLDRGLSLFRDPEVAAEARRNAGARIALSHERPTPDRLVLRVKRGEPAAHVVIYAMFENREPLPVFSGAFGPGGSVAVPVPLPQDLGHEDVRFVALTVKPWGAVVFSNLVRLTL